MVKGISRQVIVLQSPEPKLFEQAIFILRDGQKEVTDEMLLAEAKKIMHTQRMTQKGVSFIFSFLCACAGALLTGLVWLITVLV